MTAGSTGPIPTQGPKPLAGWRVLVPRGGPWGDSVAADIRAYGGSPVVAPMINFAPTSDEASLVEALTALADGHFDWLTVTSATTVDVLAAHQARIPSNTRVAAVGETTAAALLAAGYHADLIPSADNSAVGLLDEWPQATRGEVPLKILTLRSEIAKPTLTDGLAAMGHDVQSVVAYRTVGIPVMQNVADDVASGRINAILVTSGSVAEQVQLQLGPLPETTFVAAIGPRTARDAKAVGLKVDVIAVDRTAESLVDSVAEAAERRAAS
ncbi:uroporphyrinogen-III synthase [Humibacter ginsenosidimutans]|uniref:Uroporphyrinogen-III synthase n=1 Tax=Humibacter ginsenosidimutans TaxID=2599293 RepID=A0A5B8M7P6_9MICO|nr:uroporphyrinogen-III synthase [Humibacter ginsenosidimutans]QDZ15622.1 uroporphyrinogen-III synthase [Humibacter ginsenosidimutans]